MPKVLLWLLTIVFAGVSVGQAQLLSSDDIKTYKQVSLQQESLPEITDAITAKTQSCFQVYSELRRLSSSSVNYRAKFDELQSCMAKSQENRDKFTEQSAPVYAYRKLERPLLLNAGWTNKQIDDLDKWWGKIRELSKRIDKFNKPDKSGATYDSVREYSAKLY